MALLIWQEKPRLIFVEISMIKLLLTIVSMGKIAFIKSWTAVNALNYLIELTSLSILPVIAR